ncbi:F0F1 ATP synthase subunit gamma, partial [Streptomyces caeruleatus]
NRAVSALATHTRNLDHPLTTQVEKPRRAALVVFTSDRGMNGAFNSNVLKVAAQMRTRLEDQGMEVKRYVVGRKGMAYMK